MSFNEFFQLLAGMNQLCYEMGRRAPSEPPSAMPARYKNAYRVLTEEDFKLSSRLCLALCCMVKDDPLVPSVKELKLLSLSQAEWERLMERVKELAPLTGVSLEEVRAKDC